MIINYFNYVKIKDIVCSDPPTSIQTIKFTWDLGREKIRTYVYFCFAHQVIKIVNISVLDIHLLCGYRDIYIIYYSLNC